MIGFRGRSAGRVKMRSGVGDKLASAGGAVRRIRRLGDTGVALLAVLAHTLRVQRRRRDRGVSDLG